MSIPQVYTKSEFSELKFGKIKLGKISGVHPIIANFYNKFEIPPFRFPVSEISAKDLFALNQRLPIGVAKHHGHLRCVGNIRMFRALVDRTSLENEIFCIDASNCEESELIASAISELIYLPPIAGIHFSEVQIIAELARKASEENLIPTPPSGTDQLIAKLYGVDRRKLAKPTAAKPAHSPKRQAVFEIRKNGKLIGHFTSAESITADQLMQQFSSHELSFFSPGSDGDSAGNVDRDEPTGSEVA